LYGSSSVTKEGWRIVTQDVVASGYSPDVVDRFFSHIVVEPLQSRVGQIVLWDPQERGRATEPHWRFFRVSQTFSCIQLELPDLAGLVARQRRAILRGMEHCWFTLSMLIPNGVSAADAEDELFVSDYCRPMLSWFLYWLPETIDLLP